MTIIEIADISPPGYNKKQGTVTAVDGSTWKAWPELLSNLAVGKRYSVEFTTSTFKGKEYRTISKAEPAAGNGNGHAAEPRNTSAPNEMHFVTTLLAAFITSGQIKPGDKQTLWQTVKDLRGCYAATFGTKDGQRTH